MTKICTIYDRLNDFYDISTALRYLYNASISIQNHPEVQELRILGLAYAYTYATIKMQSPRRTGNTEAIGELCNYLKFQWLIMAPTITSIENVRSRCRSLYKGEILKFTKTEMITDKMSLKFATINRIDSYRGVKLRGIIVDCASTIAKEGIERVYELQPCMQDYPTEHFLFVG